MGFTGVLGKAVFSKNKSFSAPHDHHHHHHSGGGKRWSSSVRSCLCGHELLLDSVLAEEDSASVKTFVTGRSSEATVTQPILTQELTAVKTDEEDQRFNIKEETAAMRIQTAFRHYMARFHSTEAESSSCNAEELIAADKESPYEESESVCTSLEVQTANSVNILSLTHKAKEQPVKFKEEWDDSTVSSNISKMRMQNRMEAMTRRERALAYAFSQQLRICSKKRASRSDNEETNNMGWNWLERWMAARIPDNNDFHCTKLHTKNPSSPDNVSSFENSREEKESCGSNEVFLRFRGSFSVKSLTSSQNTMPVKIDRKSSLKPKRSVSKRKTVPSYQFAKEYCNETNQLNG